MFRSARIKLTSWYLIIIMLISISFSVVAFRILTMELDRVERVQRLRVERQLPERFRMMMPQSENNAELFRLFALEPKVVNEAKERLAALLILINLGILAGSALAGYFLAGRTLNPIKEMVEEQNRFITDASHELRTPLTSLKTEIEVNLRDPQLTLSTAKSLLKSNLEEVGKLQTLTDGLIRMIQNQEGKKILEIKKISLAEITREAMAAVESLAKNKNIIINNEAVEETIEADQSALTEAFIILLDNAVKYSNDGEAVKVTTEKTDGHLLIKIIDQGIGIDEKNLPHIFDRFFRADRSRTKTTGTGYGLGLAIAQQIVYKHHGTISVKSKIAEGSTFTIRLPLKQIKMV